MNTSAAGLTVESARHRFVLLTALRWLPIGISIPVTVLLASSRGLSPADIGLVFAAHSVTAMLLELPTGGLADAIGRRPVLVLSALLQIAGLLTIAVAPGLLMFAVALSLVGAGRALDSGPLESWYVDAVHLLDEGADVTPGLAQASVADGAGLALGTVVGGVAPLLASRLGGSDALMLPFLLAAGLTVVYLIGVVVLVVPIGPGISTASGRAIGAAMRSVPTILRDTMTLAARDRTLRQLLVITYLVGIVLTALELIGPLRIAELTGSRAQGTAVFGVVMAVSFTAAALGAGLATSTRRLARGSVALASAAGFGLCALAVTAVALSPMVVALGIAYACFYLFNATGWPLRQELMHSRVDAARRSTTVSAASFALMIGGITGNLLLPRLAEATSLTVALHVAALPLLLGAVLSLRLRSAAPRTELGSGLSAPVVNRSG
ncbi:MAG: MFS transporter [Mycobacteriales bacterium]